MSRRVIVIGRSDQGRQAIDIIEEAGGVEIVGVLDRDTGGSSVAGYPLMGSDEELAAYAESERADAFLVAIGDNFSRHRVLARETARCPELEPLRVVHPSAAISRSADIGPASIIMAGAVVGNACCVGRGTLLGAQSSLDHDCILEDGASLAPGVTTGGRVRIGECTAVGVGVSVIHGVEIGSNSVVGAGALVVDNVPDRVVAYGAPARVVRSRNPDEPYLTAS
jgi:sugar O-acyltransferase (sialic acid O-acetyltransferase NeuD family)